LLGALLSRRDGVEKDAGKDTSIERKGHRLKKGRKNSGVTEGHLLCGGKGFPGGSKKGISFSGQHLQWLTRGEGEIITPSGLNVQTGKKRIP